MEYGLVLRWLAVVFALGAVGLPVAAGLFPRFHDQGASLALPVSLAAVTLTAYWVGHLTFGPVALAVALLALGGAALFALRHGVQIDRTRAAETAVVFLGAFGLVVAIRAVSPGIVPAGGEKFLNSALLNSLLRTPVLPPEDPWFAGEPVRYYYGGHLLAAVLTRLSGVPPRYAFNLALATAYGALAVATYGLVGTLADSRGRSARVGGLLGIALVCLGGNLATPARFLLSLTSQEFAVRYFEWVYAGIRASPAAAYEAAGSLQGFSYWFGRYVVPGTLNPFPFWAFNNGDLNAYMVATPFLLLAVAVALAYYRTPATERTRRRLLAFVALPLVAGLLGITSTWSLPTAAGLLFLALVFAEPDPASLLPTTLADRIPGTDVTPGELSLSTEIRRVLVAAGVAGVALALAVVVGAPFLLFLKPANGGVGFLPPRSRLGPLFLVHGAFLAAFALAFAPAIRHRILTSTSTSTSRRRALAALVLALPIGGVALWFRLDAVVLVFPFLLVGWALARLDPDRGFAPVLVVAGAGLVLVVEFAYAKVWPHDPNAPRWNTVYKVYMQVWLVWGVAAAAVLAGALERSWDAVRERDLTTAHVAQTAVVITLLLGVMAFPVATLGAQFHPVYADDAPDRLSLNGTAYVEAYHPNEAAAIRWLREEVSGQPNMVSKPGEPMYTWKNGPASLTGVPAVLGWHHEAGYRGQRAWQTRRLEIEVIYTAEDPETVRVLLDKYDVRYIYVGPNERAAYDDPTFEEVSGLTVAFRNEGVTIYRVNDSIVDPDG